MQINENGLTKASAQKMDNWLRRFQRGGSFYELPPKAQEIYAREWSLMWNTDGYPPPPDELAERPADHWVYLVRMPGHCKFGRTANFSKRTQAYRQTSHDIRVVRVQRVDYESTAIKVERYLKFTMDAYRRPPSLHPADAELHRFYALEAAFIDAITLFASPEKGRDARERTAPEPTKHLLSPC